MSNSPTVLQFAGLLQAPANGVQAIRRLARALTCYRHIEDVFPQGGIGAQINLNRGAAALGVDEILNTTKGGRHDGKYTEISNVSNVLLARRTNQWHMPLIVPDYSLNPRA